MNPRETCLLLANFLECCWGIAAAGRQGLISQGGMAREVSLGHGEERVIMLHLLLERIAAVGLPTWGLRALAAPRPTVIFPSERVSLASTPGKLSHLAWPHTGSRRKRQDWSRDIILSICQCPNSSNPGCLKVWV